MLSHGRASFDICLHGYRRPPRLIAPADVIDVRRVRNYAQHAAHRSVRIVRAEKTMRRSRAREENTIVTNYARTALRELRSSGIEDDEILERFTAPHVTADRRFEALQIKGIGKVEAPALAVKAEMKRLLMH
jgi:hypothetical protein